MQHDPRTTYAKASDIKGRTSLEYRLDMKRKAIAELEAMTWIEDILKEQYHGKEVRVEKSGGDRFLWFLRRGGVSREPDYIAHMGEQQKKIEFQYAEKESLDFYDFKITKVVSGKKRTPRSDVLFLYIDKPRCKYALLNAEWIHQNAKIDEVPAWRTQAYRVPADKFQKLLVEDEKLKPLIESIDAKNALLRFQGELYQRMRDNLQAKIEETVVSKTTFSIVPETLEGFFEACFILSVIEKCPQQINSWLEQGLRHGFSSLAQAFMAAFSLDFLYFCLSSTEGVEPSRIAHRLKQLSSFVDAHFNNDGSYSSRDGNLPCEETRYALFVVNIVEDIIQDMLHYYAEALPEGERPEPIRRIFQSLRDPLRTAQYVRQSCIPEA
ncbi:MAG: hypothetical protein CFK49_03010 [Armatimonadetes bacterium JP3_11]|jgi:hypothetical protein|nr:MAG: hypothetical protein CFK49_03010 [Armatimonadetes bacterium JP3_11]RMH07204.1 MAG: hypothetical protein D6697_09050 [Armatimonadota bacterium]